MAGSLQGSLLGSLQGFLQGYLLGSWTGALEEHGVDSGAVLILVPLVLILRWVHTCDL